MMLACARHDGRAELASLAFQQAGHNGLALRILLLILRTLVDAIRYFAGPQVCHDFVTALRWPNGVACRLEGCGSDLVQFIATRRIWRPKACKRQFSVKVGTIFEGSPIPKSAPRLHGGVSFVPQRCGVAALEDLTIGTVVEGIVPGVAVSVVSAKWHGSSSATVVYRDSAAGNVGQQLLFRSDEHRLHVVDSGRQWAFDGDGHLFRLVSEAQRIKLAYLFDPMLAVHISNVVPLPHQIAGVYGEMLGRQPLRFLLADDPGAASTTTSLQR